MLRFSLICVNFKTPSDLVEDSSMFIICFDVVYEVASGRIFVFRLQIRARRSPNPRHMWKWSVKTFSIFQYFFRFNVRERDRNCREIAKCDTERAHWWGKAPRRKLINGRVVIVRKYVEKFVATFFFFSSHEWIRLCRYNYMHLISRLSHPTLYVGSDRDFGWHFPASAATHVQFSSLILISVESFHTNIYPKIPARHEDYESNAQSWPAAKGETSKRNRESRMKIGETDFLILDIFFV